MVRRPVTPYAKVWILICFVVLLGSIYFVDPGDEHSLLFLFIPMIILSFPGGFVVPYIIGGIAYLLLKLGIENPFKTEQSWDIWYFSMYIGYWATFVAIGYIQWFVLLPYLRRRVRQIGSDH